MVMVDLVVKACLEKYNLLSKSGKPKEGEWTVISAIVQVVNMSNIKVLSLGTGSKCIGRSSMSPKGDILNDSHAEVIARRAFMKYLYLQIIKLLKSGTSEVLCWDDKSESRIIMKDSVKFYFVTSMSPCGDASIMPKHEYKKEDEELFGLYVSNPQLRNEKNPLKRSVSLETEMKFKKLKSEIAKNEVNFEDMTKPDTDQGLEQKEKDIHRTGAKCLATSPIQDPHLPGTFYHSIGAVRTKPGRGDPTLSVSCSDKIAKWNCVGWEGALLSLLIKTPIFVDGIICGSGCPFSKESFDRAVNKRINRKEFVPIHLSTVSFQDIKDPRKKPCPLSLIWCAMDGEKPEVSINGRKQGVTKKNLNKKSARTSICKKELLNLFGAVLNSFPHKEKVLHQIFGHSNFTIIENMSYSELKLRAKDYQQRWETVKNENFKVWTDKPVDLLNFTLKDE